MAKLTFIHSVKARTSDAARNKFLRQVSASWKRKYRVVSVTKSSGPFKGGMNFYRVKVKKRKKAKPNP